jgi:hypothetical protein
MTQTFVSGGRVQLAKKLNPWDATLVATTDLWITKGRIYFKNDSQEEWISFSGVAPSWADFAYTITLRSLSQTAIPATGTTGLTWLASTVGYNVAMHDQVPDLQEPTQYLQVAKTYASTAARDAALWGNGVATFNYTDVKVTATGLFYNYNTTSGQWEVQGTWTATPNASATVSWSVEIATNAEVTAWTDTWWTGALLVVLPSQIKKSISLKTAGTTFGDTDEIAVNISWEDKRITWANLRESIPASTTAKWTVELATNAEVITSTDATRYISPSQLRYKTGMNLSTSNVTVTQWGTTRANSASAQSVKGGMVTVIRNYDWSGAVNNNSWGLEFSPDNSAWTQMWWEWYAWWAAQNPRHVSPSFILNAWYYYRVFAGWTGSSTVALTVTAYLQEAA